MDRREILSAAGLIAALAAGPGTADAAPAAFEPMALAFLPKPGEYTPLAAVSSDGVAIAGQSWGNRAGPPLVFIHGYEQSGFCFLKQARGPLARKYHIITYDMRGHGQSGKPMTRAAYHDARLFADDFMAVVDAAGVRGKVMPVGWSLGGRAVWDVLRYYPDRVAGAQLVGGGLGGRPEWASSSSAAREEIIPRTLESSLDTNIWASANLLATCFHKPPPLPEFLCMLAYNMVQPPEVRKLLVRRARQPIEFIRTVRHPVRFVIGEHDYAPGAAKLAAAAAMEALPGSEAIVIPGVGHSPFYEDAEAFDRQLDAFASRVFGA